MNCAVNESSAITSTPNPDDESLIAAIRLNLISGIGPRTQQILLGRFGSPAGVFAATREDLHRVQGVGPKLAQAILSADNRGKAIAEITRCREQGYDILVRESQNYPGTLKTICDAPSILYCRGSILTQDQLAVGMVGSRRCTLYGRQQAERFAGALARAGFTIVSGLARGIDASAHIGALKAGGRTVAVFATGLANIYPPEHEELANEVVESGAIVSESGLDQPPVAGLFPQRNRIISGMSLGVIIIEATRKSGALHTARHAMEQGREVLVLPGRVDSPASEGCLDLIRDGATMVRNVDDVLEALGPLPHPVEFSADSSSSNDADFARETPPTVVHTPRELLLNDQEREVLNLVTTEPRHIDEVLRSVEMESSRVLATLTVLEMKRLVRRLPGGNLVRST